MSWTLVGQILVLGTFALIVAVVVTGIVHAFTKPKKEVTESESTKETRAGMD